MVSVRFGILAGFLALIGAPPLIAAASPLVVPVPTTRGHEAQVAEHLRALLAGKKLQEIVPRTGDREAIIALYQKANFRPLWVAEGAPSERARTVLEHLKGIDADGLDPRDYPMPRLTVADAGAQAEAELRFTATLLTYARHAMTGRIHFSRVSPNIDYKLAFDAEDVLTRIAAANDLRKTLDSLNPPQPAYRALKGQLAALRRAPDEPAPLQIAHGPVLKYFRYRSGREYVMSDPRVPLLRTRLGLPSKPDTRYDAALAEAVAQFQRSNGVQPTSQLNAPTVAALNGPSRARQIEAVLATMERWRWMPRDLGRTHVILNVPDFTLWVSHNGEKVWRTRVVVGKRGHETPLLSETMKSITVNPTWNVPQSIIYNELLPIYEASDPQIFERLGLKLERDRNGHVRVYQPPGERNALGQLRFNFPNKFLVYQHDTPERYYFTQDKRAYSHGCMRVQDPVRYAEVLLSYASPHDRDSIGRIEQMLGGQERQIALETPVPVHITYQTAFVDDHGRLQIRDDIYGLDAKLMAILGGRERAVADVPVARPADPNFKPTAEQGMRLRNVAGDATTSTLFDRLFR